MRTNMIRKISVLMAVILTVTAIPMSAGADTASSMDGSYILANGYTKYYAGITASTPSQGTGVQQQTYVGNSTQTWTITKISGTDRYWIKNGSYCLGVSTGGSEAYMMLNYGSSTSYLFQQWYLDPIEMIDGRFGRFKIRNADPGHSNKVLGVSSTGTNTNVVLINYVNDSYMADEWILCPTTEFTTWTQPQYDTGYTQRYTQYTTRISNHMLELQRIYLTLFGIRVNYPSPAHVTTLFDSCPADYDERCTCYSDNSCHDSDSTTTYTIHHTNLKNNIYYLAPAAANQRKIIFFGHRYCTEANHDSELIGGIAAQGRRSAYITTRGTVKKELSVVVHEFNHLYGVVDHYGYDDDGDGNPDSSTTDDLDFLYPNDGYSTYCIHGEQREYSTVLNTTQICPGCQERVLDYRAANR